MMLINVNGFRLYNRIVLAARQAVNSNFRTSLKLAHGQSLARKSPSNETLESLVTSPIPMLRPVLG